MGIIDWSGAIKIAFDLQIITDVEITEVVAVKNASGTASASQDYYGSYPASNAFNGSLSDRWLAYYYNADQWIKMDFGSAKTMRKVRMYTSTSWGIKDYRIEGSANNTDWITVSTGQVANITGWTEKTFTEASYRYWRIYCINCWSNYIALYELEFYEAVSQYVISGWTITADEYSMQPDGILVAKTYPVKKVTKSEDGLEITLWLDMYHRMMAPAGLVTITYDKTAGNLMGQGNMQVESFSLVFTPTGLTPIINPNVHETLTALVQQIVTVSEVTYTDTRSPHEYITATLDLDITVTKVGDLPL